MLLRWKQAVCNLAFQKTSYPQWLPWLLQRWETDETSMLYKLYSNDFLESLCQAGIGAFIGPVYVGQPRVADDSLLMSFFTPELQAMLIYSFDNSVRHHYVNHQVKFVMTYHHAPQIAYKSTTSLQFFLGEQPVTVTDQFLHLSLLWKEGKVILTLALRSAVLAGQLTLCSM